MRMARRITACLQGILFIQMLRNIDEKTDEPEKRSEYEISFEKGFL